MYLKGFNVILLYICRMNTYIYIYIYTIILSHHEKVHLMSLFGKILLPSLGLIKRDVINLLER